MYPKLRLAGALVASGLMAFLALPVNGADNPNTRVVEEIVAKVNGDIITRGELVRQREQFREELMAQGVREPQLSRQVEQRAADALKEQIDQLLLVQKGKDLTISVDSEVNKYIAQIQSEAKIADTEKFHEYVREKTGESFEDFKLQLKNRYLTQRVIGQEVGRNITIPTADLQKFYEEHKSDFVRQEMVLLREILIAPKDNSPAAIAEAEKKAKDIVARARKGTEKFGDLARQNSAAATAQQDGEFGAFKPGELKKEIDEIVFKQNKGYVTDPIRLPAGFEILKVEDRYAAGQASFDEVKDQIQGKFYEEKMAPMVRTYLTQLRQNAFLEIKPGFVDSGAAPGKDTTWKDPAQLRPETTTKEEVAARKKRRLLGVIPAGSKKVKTDVKKGSSDPVATPTAVPATPVTDTPASSAAPVTSTKPALVPPQTPASGSPTPASSPVPPPGVPPATIPPAAN